MVKAPSIVGNIHNSAIGGKSKLNRKAKGNPELHRVQGGLRNWESQIPEI
jgi:hypothetical protein